MAGSIDLRRDGHAAILTISHEARRNALSLAMWRMLPTLVAEASADPDIRVIVLEGAGAKAFCAGADISEFATLRDTPERVEAYEVAVDRALTTLAACPKPTVAAIRGVCFGGGLELALACDLRLADDSALFRMPGAQLGLGYTLSAIEMFVQRIGQAATAEIMFAGRAFGAADALRFGVVQNVHPVASFETGRDALVETIAGNAPLTLIATKRALIELARPAGARDAAAVDALVAACFASSDYAEGRKAFSEKRRPLFKAAAETAPIERK